MQTLLTTTAEFVNVAAMRRTTIIVCIVVTVGLIGWDIACCCVDQTQNAPTISHVLRKANALSGGLVALAFIALVIHLFFPQLLPLAWREP